MTTHAIAVIVLADYLPNDLLEHPSCAPGLFTPITADGAPVEPVRALMEVEAPRQLFSTLVADHQHISLWGEAVLLQQQVQCVGIERLNVPEKNSLLCRQFLTLHLTSESAHAMERVLKTLAHVRTQAALTLLARLPFQIIPSPLVQRAFTFLHTDETSDLDVNNPLVHVVPSHVGVSPGHWTHGRLSFAAQVLALQLANQVLLDLLPTPDGTTPSGATGGDNEYVAAVRNYLAHAWWPDFSLDPATILVAESFYSNTRLRIRVAEERETMRDVWAAAEANNSRLLNRVGVVLGTSAVIAGWFAIAAGELPGRMQALIAGVGGVATVVLAAYAPRLGRKK
ncbi:MAG: hypothetical protein EBS41_04920 [Actinobacteria bacterium]|nr:hypothetical protein [Actinomycetota bacterium]